MAAEKKRLTVKLLLLLFLVLLILPFWFLFFLLLWVIEKIFGQKNKVNRASLKEICKNELDQWESLPAEEIFALEFPYIYSIPHDTAEIEGELLLIDQSPESSHLVLNVHGSGKGMSLTQNIFSVCAPVGKSLIIEHEVHDSEEEEISSDQDTYSH